MMRSAGGEGMRRRGLYDLARRSRALECGDFSRRFSFEVAGKRRRRSPHSKALRASKGQTPGCALEARIPLSLPRSSEAVNIVVCHVLLAVPAIRADDCSTE